MNAAAPVISPMTLDEVAARVRPVVTLEAQALEVRYFELQFGCILDLDLVMDDVREFAALFTERVLL